MIDALYLRPHAMSAHVALMLVAVRAEVSLGALWAAYRGFRVSPDTAVRLKEWVYMQHGVEDLDVEGLCTAPRRPRRGDAEGSR